MWFGTFTHTCTTPQRMVVGNRHLQGMLYSPTGQVSCEFWANWPRFSFLGEGELRGLALLKMVPHQWPVALVVIWHIYSCLACSSEDSARDLPSSGKVVLGQGQVPCEFQGYKPNFIFQPVAPDIIWHIYFWQCYLNWVLGMDLLSSGDVALMMGRSLWVLRRSANLHVSASGSWCDLAHLLTPVLLLKGWWQGLAIFRGGSPYHGAGPLWVSSRSANLHFSASGSWCDLVHLLAPVLLLEGWR